MISISVLPYILLQDPSNLQVIQVAPGPNALSQQRCQTQDERPKASSDQIIFGEAREHLSAAEEGAGMPSVQWRCQGRVLDVVDTTVQ